MKRLSLNIFITIIAFSNLASAEVQTKQGTIIHKGWTKSIQSYQAGGSDYFVLYEGDDVFYVQDDNGNKTERLRRKETILRPSEDVPLSEFKKFIDKYVEIKGEMTEGEIVDIPDDDYSQHPMEFSLNESGEVSLKTPKTKAVGAGFKVYAIEEIRNPAD